MFWKTGENQQLIKPRLALLIMISVSIGFKPFETLAGPTSKFHKLAVAEAYDDDDTYESIVPATKATKKTKQNKYYVADDCNTKTVSSKGGVSLKDLVSELIEENKLPQSNKAKVASMKTTSKKSQPAKAPAGMSKKPSAKLKVASPIASYTSKMIASKNGPSCRLHPILKRYKTHAGIDLDAKTGTPIVSVMDGVVVFSGTAGGYGNLVTVKHTLPNGKVIYSKYAHMTTKGKGCALPKPGTKVKQGQKLGCVGSTGRSTGPHLHFEIRSEAKGGTVYDSKHFLLSNGELKLGKTCGRK